jgi:hypothetical protein
VTKSDEILSEQPCQFGVTSPVSWGAFLSLSGNDHSDQTEGLGQHVLRNTGTYLSEYITSHPSRP